MEISAQRSPRNLKRSYESKSLRRNTGPARNDGGCTQSGLADATTPSHNLPHDGGFKYNPPNGELAEGIVTAWIQARANEFLEALPQSVKQIPFEKAFRATTTTPIYTSLTSPTCL
jgi:phosphoglucomutase